MALVSLRELVNNPNAPTYDASASATDVLFAEDWNELRRAIQLGSKAINTRGITTAQGAVISTDLAVGGNATISGTLVVALAAVLQAGLTITGNLSVSGTVDGVDIAAHTHTGTDGSTKIPLSSVSGASGAWSAHGHNGDGSSQISAGGLAADSVTFSVIDPTSIGLTSSTVARGDYLNSVRARLATLFGASISQFPMVGQWISAFQMQGAGADTAAVLTEDTGVSPAKMVGLKFRGGQADAIRFSFVVPSYVTGVKLFYTYWVDGDVPSPGLTIDQEIVQTPLGSDGDSGLITTDALQMFASEDIVSNFEAAALSFVDSPTTHELVSVRMVRDAGDGVSENLFLAGAFVSYDINLDELEG